MSDGDDRRRLTLKERLDSFAKSDSAHLDYNQILYDFPELYYAYLPDPNIYPAIDAIIEKYCPDLEQGILDLGCGGGKVLAEIGNLNRKAVTKVGVDAHSAMIEYGVEQFGDQLELLVGDVKSFRYPKQFSLVLCVGTVLQYAYTNAELRQMLATVTHHMIPGGTVMLDIKNSSTYLAGFDGIDKFLETRTVDYGFFKGTKTPRASFDLEKQLLKLHVDWEVSEPTKAKFTDFCQYRIILPQELVFAVEAAGLVVRELSDSFLGKSANFTGDRIIVVAQKPL